MFSHLDEVEMTRKYRKEHDLMGYEGEDLVDDFDGIGERDVVPFLYPDNSELERVGVRGIYLNNFIRWDSRAQHEQMISLYGYETDKQTRTFDFYNDVDCWNYSDVHDHIKYLKHGYGKVVDHACREIRLRRMTRKEAIGLVRSYGTRTPCNLDLFLEWIGMTENAFHYIIDQHRNHVFWRRDGKWEWELTSDHYHSAAKADDSAQAFSTFTRDQDYILTPVRRSSDARDRYILIGKGHE